MCVAVIVNSPSGIAADDLRRMSEDNPHGGGMAWFADGKVHYRKGLTWQEIAWQQAEVPRPVLIHFRWATHGPRVPQLAHPFPLGFAALSDRLTGTARAVLIHNGTWGDYVKHVPTWLKLADVSDTQIAALVAATNPKILDDLRWAIAVLRASPEGAIVEYRGTWQKIPGSDGDMASNLNWQNRSRTYPTYQGTTRGYLGGWGGSDDEDTGRHYRYDLHKGTGATVGASPAPSSEVTRPLFPEQASRYSGRSDMGPAAVRTSTPAKACALCARWFCGCSELDVARALGRIAINAGASEGPTLPSALRAGHASVVGATSREVLADLRGATTSAREALDHARKAYTGEAYTGEATPLVSDMPRERPSIADMIRVSAARGVVGTKAERRAAKRARRAERLVARARERERLAFEASIETEIAVEIDEHDEVSYLDADRAAIERLLSSGVPTDLDLDDTEGMFSSGDPEYLRGALSWDIGGEGG